MKRDWNAYRKSLDERLTENVYIAGQHLATAKVSGCQNCEAAAHRHARRAARISRMFASLIIHHAAQKLQEGMQA